MKATIRLLVRFMFWFAVLVLVATALVVAHGYVTGYDPAAASAGSLAGRLLTALSLSWIPAVLLAAVIALFSGLRSLDAPAVALLTLLAGWTILLVAGGFLRGAYPAQERDRPIVIPERRLVRHEDLRLYALERNGLFISPLVVHDQDRNPGFSVVPEATLDPVMGELRVPADDRFPRDLSQLSSSYPAMVDVPAFLRPVLRDISETGRLLAVSGETTAPVLLNLFALSFFVLGTWSLVRLTRWPLFNALLALGALRFAVWIVPTVHVGLLRDMLIAAFDSRALPYASALILGVVGLGLLALLVFLPSLADWRREADHG